MDCDIIVCSALDDGASYFELAEEISSAHVFYSVVRPYYVTLKKHNYIPYISDTYIQNKTITSDAYISGENIYMGSSVTPWEPSGEVLINDDANITIDATNNVIFSGVSINDGADITIDATNNVIFSGVLINDGADITIDATNDVVLNGSFEFEPGGTFEIIK